MPARLCQVQQICVLAGEQHDQVPKVPTPSFQSKKESKRLSRMIALIRISVLLKYTEEPSGTLHLELTAKNSTLILLFQNKWLDAHPLTRQAIDKEKILLADIGITLQTSG